MERFTPNPDYPEGRDLNPEPHAVHKCTVELAYPQDEPGSFEILCHHCKLFFQIYAYGQSDDPRFIQLPCYFQHFPVRMAVQA